MELSNTAVTLAGSENILELTPDFSVDEALDFAREIFSIVATAEPRPSERDQNCTQADIWQTAGLLKGAPKAAK